MSEMSTESIRIEHPLANGAEVNAEEVWSFPTGLIGLPDHRRFVLLPLEGAPLRLLASLDDPAFGLVLGIISVLAYGLEASRRRYFEGLLAETVAVEDALAQVKILRGLLPICTRCKSVRDDRGYWNRLEAYIQARSDAKFSHGICPSCHERLYPEYPSED